MFFSQIYATYYGMVPSVLSDFEDKTKGLKTYSCLIVALILCKQPHVPHSFSSSFT